MNKDIPFEKLIEKLGLVRASDLPVDSAAPEKIPSSHTDKVPSNESITENKNSHETSSLLQKLRERLNTISSIIPEKEREYPTHAPVSLKGGTIIGNERSQCLYFSETYPHPYAYGDVILADALRFSIKEAKISSAGNEMEFFNPEKALFIDTETTSCFGGTGTVAFLVGIGYFSETDFHLEQFFMRDYDDEPALLYALDERIKNAEIFIGYNSKCFDLPLLRNRYLMNRIPFHGENLLHFDLMHVARRFWNRRLSDCSLSTVERYILNMQRYGDVPGSLIPRLWLSYIQTRKPQWIPRILEHNRRDILALAGLMAWIALRVQVPKGQGFEEVLDRCALMRLQMKCGHYNEVIEIAEHLLEDTKYASIRSECWKILSEVYRKLEKTDERERILLQWAGEEPENIYPKIELAKIYEHQQKQLEQALYWTEQALQSEPSNHQILKRKERLLRKIQTTQNLSYDD